MDRSVGLPTIMRVKFVDEMTEMLSARCVHSLRRLDRIAWFGSTAAIGPADAAAAVVRLAFPSVSHSYRRYIFTQTVHRSRYDNNNNNYYGLWI